MFQRLELPERLQVRIALPICGRRDWSLPCVSIFDSLDWTITYSLRCHSSTR